MCDGKVTCLSRIFSIDLTNLSHFIPLYTKVSKALFSKRAHDSDKMRVTHGYLGTVAVDLVEPLILRCSKRGR